MPPITNPELVGLALGAALFGLGTLANAAYRWRRWRPRPDWGVTTGRIESAVPMTYSTPAGRGSAVWTAPQVWYRYEVDGCGYTALLEGARMPGGRNVRDPEALATAFPKGQEFAVHYDPADPERAVPAGYADRSWPVLLVLGAGFLALGGWLGAGAVAAPPAAP